MIDIHSHILPGVDDGARTLTDSVDLVRELVKGGITDIIATPHFVAETRFTVDRKVELKLLSDLRQALLGEGINVNVSLGNEIYIDKSIVPLIGEGKISSLAGSEYLLVELSLNGGSLYFDDIIKDLIGVGFKVVLAHPERYALVQENYELLNDWRDWGVFFQCNLGSIMGEYGKMAKKIVKKMIEDNLVFAFGSDIHYRHGADYWVKAQKRITKYSTKGQAKRVFETNPRRLLGAS